MREKSAKYADVAIRNGEEYYSAITKVYDGPALREITVTLNGFNIDYRVWYAIASLVDDFSNERSI